MRGSVHADGGVKWLGKRTQQKADQWKDEEEGQKEGGNEAQPVLLALAELGAFDDVLFCEESRLVKWHGSAHPF